MIILLILVVVIIIENRLNINKKIPIKQIMMNKIKKQKNKMMIPLKYLSDFWRTLEMPLINCEVKLILTWYKNFVLSSNTAANQPTTFAVTDTRRYVPVVTLSTQDNARLLQQIKSSFKNTLNWNKHQSKVSMQVPNPYLDYIIDRSFQGVNRVFALSFENSTHRTMHTKHYLLTVEIKDYNVIIDRQNLFEQPVKNDLRTFDNIRKIAVGRGDDYTTSCLLDYNYFKDYYKMIAIDLSKQEALEPVPKTIQQINFTGNLN